MTTSNTTIKTGQCEFVMDGTRCRTFHSKELSIFCGEHDVSIGMADPQTMEISFYNEPPLSCLPDAESDLSQPLYRNPEGGQNREPNSSCDVCGVPMLVAEPQPWDTCSVCVHPDLLTLEEAGVEDNLYTCMGEDCDNQVSEIRQMHCWTCEEGDSAAPETEPYVTINIRESAVLGTEPKNVQFVTAEGGGFTRRMVIHRRGDGWAVDTEVDYNANIGRGWYSDYQDAVTCALSVVTRRLMDAIAGN